MELTTVLYLLQRVRSLGSRQNWTAQFLVMVSTGSCYTIRHTTLFKCSMQMTSSLAIFSPPSESKLSEFVMLSAGLRRPLRLSGAQLTTDGAHQLLQSRDIAGRAAEPCDGIKFRKLLHHRIQCWPIHRRRKLKRSLCFSARVSVTPHQAQHFRIHS